MCQFSQGTAAEVGAGISQVHPSALWTVAGAPYAQCSGKQGFITSAFSLREMKTETTVTEYRISKADGHGWCVNITPYGLEICCCAEGLQPQCRQGWCPSQNNPCLLDFIGSTKWRRQIIHDRWELSPCLTPWIWADVFWLPWTQWNPLMTAYLTFTHSDSRPLIATLHLPRDCQPGRQITNLSGGFTRDMNPALAQKWCVQWRNMETDMSCTPA